MIVRRNGDEYGEREQQLGCSTEAELKGGTAEKEANLTMDGIVRNCTIDERTIGSWMVLPKLRRHSWFPNVGSARGVNSFGMRRQFSKNCWGFLFRSGWIQDICKMASTLHSQFPLLMLNQNHNCVCVHFLLTVNKIIWVVMVASVQFQLEWLANKDSIQNHWLLLQIKMERFLLSRRNLLCRILSRCCGYECWLTSIHAHKMMSNHKNLDMAY